jgi:hypothetical protein
MDKFQTPARHAVRQALLHRVATSIVSAGLSSPIPVPLGPASLPPDQCLLPNIRSSPDGRHVLDANIHLSPCHECRTYSIEAHRAPTPRATSGSQALDKPIRTKTCSEAPRYSSSRLSEAASRPRSCPPDVADKPIWDGLPFNTLEFSPEINITIPKLVAPFRTDRLLRYGNPKHHHQSVAYNFQQRPDYTRSIFTAHAIAYHWSQGIRTSSTGSTPVEVNFVNIYNEDPQLHGTDRRA